MKLSDYALALTKPKLITLITTGTGTYIPTEDYARCFFRLQGGGGGGWASATGASGGGGAMVEGTARIPITGWAYSIGAGGAVSVDGSKSTFGGYIALPGQTPPGQSTPAAGGIVCFSFGAVDTDGVTQIPCGVTGVTGGRGGCNGFGGSNLSGLIAGVPIDISNYPTWNATTPSPYSTLFSNQTWANTAGTGSGGNSFFGLGGAANSAPVAGNYGAGGGNNAAGLGGCLEIWDFGA